MASLRGVGLFESDSFTGLRVSMAGGGYLNIAAKGETFDSDVLNNTFTYKIVLPGSTSTSTFTLPMFSGKKHTLSFYFDIELMTLNSIFDS